MTMAGDAAGFAATGLARVPAAFTARDVEPQSLSEAAFDNVRVWDLQPSCYDPVEPTE